MVSMVWGVNVISIREGMFWLWCGGFGFCVGDGFGRVDELGNWALEGRGCDWSVGFRGGGVGAGGVQCGSVVGIDSMGSVCIGAWLCGGFNLLGTCGGWVFSDVRRFRTYGA